MIRPSMYVFSIGVRNDAPMMAAIPINNAGYDFIFVTRECVTLNLFDLPFAKKSARSENKDCDQNSECDRIAIGRCDRIRNSDRNPCFPTERTSWQTGDRKGLALRIHALRK